jgi:Zn finger protein HypA/HybF involved in hydrogenase expression
MAKDEKKQELSMESLLAKLEEMEQKLEKAEKKSDEIKEVQEATLTSGQKQALLERNLQMAMEQARQDTVMITLPLLPGADDDDTAVCGVNGVLYQAKRGEEVEVPRCVAEVFRNADKQKLEARERRKGLQKKGKDKE